MDALSAGDIDSGQLVQSMETVLNLLHGGRIEEIFGRSAHEAALPHALLTSLRLGRRAGRAARTCLVLARTTRKASSLQRRLRVGGRRRRLLLIVMLRSVTGEDWFTAVRGRRSFRRRRLAAGLTILTRRRQLSVQSIRRHIVVDVVAR